MGLIDLTDLTRGYQHRPPTAATIARAATAALGRSGVLLDVGGGPGSHARQWVAPGVLPVVVDPSSSMCREAASERGVAVVRGESQHLPIRDDAASLVYFHLSIHYGSYTEAVDEALRVAAPGGVIEIWTFAPESMASSALARWFPRIGELDAARFPPIDDLARRLGRTGASVTVACLPEVVQRTAASWQAAVRNRFVSTIQLLSDSEIDEGLERFVAQYGDGEGLYTYTIDFVRIRASLQPLPCGS